MTNAKPSHHDIANPPTAVPDQDGRFGIYGGRFVAETLMPLILEVEKAYADARQDPEFLKQIEYYAQHYVG